MEHDINKIIPQAIVGVIILALVVLPLIGAFVDTASYDTTVYENDGTAVKMRYFDSESGSYTLAASGGTITTTGGVIAIPEDTAAPLPIFISSSLVVEATTSGVNVYTASGSATGTAFSMTASAGQITYSVDSADAVQTTYGKAAIAYRGGESSQQTAASEKYYTDISQVFGYRYDSGLYVYAGGTAYTNGSEASYTVTSTDVDGTDGMVKKLTSIRYTSSKNLTHIVLEDAPVLKVEKDPGMAMHLVGIVGVVLAVALVLMVVRVAVVNRHAD